MSAPTTSLRQAADLKSTNATLKTDELRAQAFFRLRLARKCNLDSNERIAHRVVTSTRNDYSFMRSPVFRKRSDARIEALKAIQGWE